jgi:F-type H+-transporting ATPase subunit beta
MQTGKIISIVGAIVDVEFPAGSIPKIYDALKIDAVGLILETQQQLGDEIGRAHV